jgi:hypothetical protein
LVSLENLMIVPAVAAPPTGLAEPIRAAGGVVGKPETDPPNPKAFGEARRRVLY